MNDTKTLTVASPGESPYAVAIEAYNLLPQLGPRRTVIARSVEDVCAAVRFARDNDLTASVIATGHSAATSQPLDGALLIRTQLDEPVVIDPEAQTATIPAGTRWAAVVAAAAEHGLAVLHGSSGTVGAVGYLLRGGISFYGRTHGIAANSIVSIRLVLADGRVVTASPDEEPDLFWALRGGGGGFGVVTSVTIRLLPMWKVYTGIAFWSAEHAEEIILAWRAWTEDAPWTLTTSMRVLNIPPLPGIPEAIAGRTVVALDGAAGIRDPYLLTDISHQAAALLDPLRAIAEPIIDTWDLRDPIELPLTHMDPPDPIPYVGDHLLLSSLDQADVRTLVDLVGASSGSTLTSVELRHLGGAFAYPPESGGAFDRTDAEFALLVVGAVGGPLTPEMQEGAADRIRRAFAHRDTGRTLPTFVESAAQPSRTFDRQTWEAVDRVRRAVDPRGLFLPNIVPFVEAG